VMGPGQKFLILVGSAIFGLGLENFRLKIPNFSIFFLSGQKKSHWVRSKSKIGWPLIFPGSKVCSVRVGGQGPTLVVTIDFFCF